MEVEIISIDLIKPSSPTPNHLKIHRVSLLDQFSSSRYGPLLLFYSPPVPEISSLAVTSLLKQSLSETLTLYYPFAGKVKDNLSIDCNDEGVRYIEAKSNSRLDDYLGDRQLDIYSLYKLLPDETQNPVITGSHVSIVQQTRFACGGIAIAFLAWHVITDALIMTAFLKTWAAFARKQKHDIIIPSFQVSSVFPSIPFFPQDSTFAYFRKLSLKTENLVSRRFFFDGFFVASLKSRSPSTSRPVTRSEVVASLLIKRFMVAAAKVEALGIQKSTVVLFSVNLRRRAIQSVEATSVGSLILLTTAVLSKDDELDGLVQKMRQATSKVNANLIKTLQDETGLMTYAQELRELCSSSTSNHIIAYNSLCNFGLYHIDYGWGRPLWIPCLRFMFKNFIFLMDTKSDNGIEAWVTLDKNVMDILEQDEELLSFAVLDPSPLELSNNAHSSSSINAISRI